MGRRLRYTIVLLLALGGLLWPAAVGAGTPDEPLAFGEPTVTPAPLVPGTPAQIAVVAQARDGTGGTVARLTFVAAIVAPDGTTSEIARRPGQLFGGWQTRRYVMEWTPPAEAAVGEWVLQLHLLDPAGVERARHTWPLPVSPDGSPPPPSPSPEPAPDPAPTPPPDPAAPPGPTPPEPPPGPDGPAIVGSATFVANIRAAMAVMASAAPADHAIVMGQVTAIREGPRNFSWAGSRAIQITASSAGTRIYAGSIVLHEAVHVRNFFADDHPAYGCDGEAKSLRAQAGYLYLMGDADTARWVESLVGTWC